MINKKKPEVPASAPDHPSDQAAHIRSAKRTKPAAGARKPKDHAASRLNALIILRVLQENSSYFHPMTVKDIAKEARKYVTSSADHETASASSAAKICLYSHISPTSTAAGRVRGRRALLSITIIFSLFSARQKLLFWTP